MHTSAFPKTRCASAKTGGVHAKAPAAFAKAGPSLLALAAAGTLLLGGCTDDIDLPSTFEEAQPVVDAWLTDQIETQTIRLSETQDYYADALPTPILGADVEVCSLAEAFYCYTFVDQGDGRYTWNSDTGFPLARVGDTLALSVRSGERTFVAATPVLRTAPIDSISFQFEDSSLGTEAGTYAQVYARDLPGPGDRYLIRTTLNDTLLNRARELNLAFDAAFDGGTTTDGIAFIFPIRAAINKTDDDGAPVALLPGDSLTVEIWSLAPAAFDFLRQAQEQILNGESQLFSQPVVNTRGNVRDVRTGETVLGMFSVSAVSRRARVFE